jgi:hypothetical protein
MLRFQSEAHARDGGGGARLPSFSTWPRDRGRVVVAACRVRHGSWLPPCVHRLFSNQYHRATAERCARLQRIETGKRAPISTIGRLSFHIVGCRTGHAFDRRSFAVENVDRERCVLQNRLVFLVEPVCRLQSRNRGASLSIQTDPTYVIGPNSGGEMIFWTKGEQLPGLVLSGLQSLCASVTAWPAGTI